MTLELLWATHALQSDRVGAARAVLGSSFQPEAATTDIPSQFAIYKWELETLVNELLTIPKQPVKRGGTEKNTSCRSFTAALAMARALRELENQEYGTGSKSSDVLKEMYRIAGRQFDWQRGFSNVPQFYRSAFIFGGPECSKYLSETHGTSLEEMSLVGFAIFAAL